MASGFSGDAGQCEEVGCREEDCVKDQKSFCLECATKTGYVRKAKQNDVGLFCEVHDKPMKLYCQQDQIAVCQICAIKYHQKPCELEDIPVVVHETREKLVKLNYELLAKRQLWIDYGVKIKICKQQSQLHLKSVEMEVNAIVGTELEEIRNKEQDAAKLINEEADEEIRIMTERINKKRKGQLRQCHEDAERRRLSFEKRQRELLDDVTDIALKTETKMRDLERDAKGVIQDMEDATERKKVLIEDDKELLEGAPQLIAKLSNTLGKTVDEGVVEHITHKVEGVQFIKGVGDDMCNGRIGGFEGKLDHNSTVEIPDGIKIPAIVGYTCNNSIVMADTKIDERHTYHLNLQNKKLNQVITTNEKMHITTCALLNDGTIVCGKYREGCSGMTTIDCITIYDQQWERIRDITIPRNTSHDYTWVFVAVDRQCMIVAAEGYQRSIYVVDPSNGTIVDEIRCPEVLWRLRGTLSTGEIIAHPNSLNSKLLVIDRLGTQKEITQAEKILNCGIDPLTDDLYLVYCDTKREMVVLDRLSGSDHKERAEVLTIQTESCEYYSSFDMCPLIPPSGELVIRSGRQCLVFRNMFTLESDIV